MKRGRLAAVAPAEDPMIETADTQGMLMPANRSVKVLPDQYAATLVAFKENSSLAEVRPRVLFWLTCAAVVPAVMSVFLRIRNKHLMILL